MEGETKERTSIGHDLCYKCIFCMIPIISSIFIIKIVECPDQIDGRKQGTCGHMRQVRQSLSPVILKIKNIHISLLICGIDVISA